MSAHTPCLALTLCCACLSSGARASAGAAAALSPASSADPCQDIGRLELLERSLARAVDRAGRMGELFARADDPSSVLPRAQRAQLVGLWRDFYLTFAELDALADRCRPGEEGRTSHLDDAGGLAAAVGWSARAAALVQGERLRAIAAGGDALAILLDEVEAGPAGARGSFGRFRQRLGERPELADLVHFVKYELPAARERERRRDGGRDAWLAAFWSSYRDPLLALLRTEAAGDGLDTRPSVRASRRAAATLRSAAVTPVAVFLGRTKVKRGHAHLISEAQVHDMLPHLEPGDVVLEKTSWYLSNYFIHGFWGHAALHLGTFEEAEAYFDTPEVRAYFEGQGLPGFGAFVRARYPVALRAWRSPDAAGRPRRVLEGDGVEAPGVFFNTAERAYGSDYIGVLRPRLSRLDKALAVIDALSYFGRPYDFDFDLRTDRAVLCTELVAKAYAGGGGRRGLTLDVDRAAAGRFVIYPNSLAELFARERGRGDAQLDFVYFLRGDEERGAAVVASERDFARSSGWQSLL